MTLKERKRLAADFAKQRGFTLAELARLGRVVDAAECAEWGIYPAAPGFNIEYPGSETVRHRYFEPQCNGQRYGQQAGGTVQAYYCPLWKDWDATCKDASVPLLITEGEFKAAAACKAGFPCIALGGVFNFASARLGQNWIPSLDRPRWDGRPVYIVFDSDAAVNPMVQLAEDRLAKRLVERGTRVHIVRIPPTV